MTAATREQQRHSESWGDAATFVVVGVACVVVGGLISAIAASSPSENSSWAVAYLVLVAGVAQVVVGVGQARLAARPVSSRMLAAEFLTWNVGNAGVIAGQLLGYQYILDVGGVVLAAALVLFFLGVRRARPRVNWERWSLYAYRAVLLVVLVSIPIGLIIGHIKAS
ncbi:MAG: hypothetical protein ACRDG3_06300 [Tepidiformaceae bacterium]